MSIKKSKQKVAKKKGNLKKSEKNETFVFSLGGSIIVPDDIDIEFLKNFRKFILKHVANGKRFVIITGGGKCCRRYQAALKEVYPEVKSEGLDWLGISTTHVNAQLIKQMFGKKADLIKNFNPNLPIESKKKIIVGAGYKPGHSTDNDTLLVAKNLGSSHIINLSNIDYVYTKDPRKFKDAIKIEEISWKDFIKLLPKKWSSGLNSPFDPIAAREAKKLGVRVSMIDGRNFVELEKCILGQSFKGTRIS